MKTENIGFKNELSFVCALLTGVAESSQVYPRITAEMFTSRELALIYKGIIELFNKGKAMDYTLVEHEMRALDNDLYAEMNGLNYVADGLLSVVDDVHVTTYADIIVDEYQRNCLRLLAMEISGKCGSRDIPVEQLLQMATTKLEEIAGLGVNSTSTRQISEIGQEVVTHHTRLLENGGTSVGYSTGLKGMDDIMGGFMRGEVAIASALTSHGKTALSLFMAVQIALKGVPVYIISLEMSMEQLYGRILMSMSTVSPENLRMHGLTETEIAVAKSLNETTLSVISGLADDPKMKAIIVNQAVPGTTEAFRRVKERRPDIITIAGEAHEDPPVIQTSADLAVNNDFVARGYLIIRTAHELGCDTFVHISFPRHMSYETMSRRVAIMRATCQELGMKFVLETAPDPTSDVGVAGAQQYILEKVPAWIETYGKNAAFFCTNDAHTEPLLKQLLAYGGFFIEADLPSPLMGYPGALGIDLSAEAGNFSAILKKVEASVVAKGGAGRFGTWAYSYGYTTTAGLGQHAINVLKGESELLKLADLMKAYGKYTAGAKWNGSFYTDVNTGVRARNHVLIYQDTYMMGKGYMGNADLVVPEKYFSIK